MRNACCCKHLVITPVHSGGNIRAVEHEVNAVERHARILMTVTFDAAAEKTHLEKETFYNEFHQRSHGGQRWPESGLQHR